MTLDPGPEADIEPLPDQRPLSGMSVLVEQTHSGPLPPAEELAGYEKVLPGAAERILRMAEREMERRIEADRSADARDKTVVETQAKLALRAQWITLVIVLSFVGLFVLAVRSGQELAGAAAAMGALATIIYALNGGRFRRNRSAADTEPTSPSEPE